MKTLLVKSFTNVIAVSCLMLSLASCQKDATYPDASAEATASADDNINIANADAGSVFLVIDEESIDNGNPPNNFSSTAVNDNIAGIGQRATLAYFKNNVGKTITLYSGEVGDEGWHALKTIPTRLRRKPRGKA
jgi:hypothetical protein